jgi:hypothetical protein
VAGASEHCLLALPQLIFLRNSLAHEGRGETRLPIKLTRHDGRCDRASRGVLSQATGHHTGGVVSIRETLNKNPIYAVILAVVCIGVFAAVMFWSGEDDEPVFGYEGKRFFSVDDGATYFAADVTNIPPFQHEGKTAYGVKVYRCADGEERVAYLERYRESALKRIRDMDGGTIKQPIKALEYLDNSGALEVKRPGETEWVRQNGPKYEEIVLPTCPDGSPVEWVRAR